MGGRQGYYSAPDRGVDPNACSSHFEAAAVEMRRLRENTLLFLSSRRPVLWLAIKSIESRPVEWTSSPYRPAGTTSMLTVGFCRVDGLVLESISRLSTRRESQLIPGSLVRTSCGVTGAIQKILSLRFTTGCFALVTLAIRIPLAIATFWTA